MLGADTPAHVSMAGVHRVAALLKRWILGTHHGAVQPEHLDAYLDEFVFRFNRRSSASRGMLFYRLLQQAVVTDPVAYANIVQSAASGLQQERHTVNHQRLSLLTVLALACTAPHRTAPLAQATDDWKFHLQEATISDVHRAIKEKQRGCRR
jgi:hypothetical protein